MCLTRRLELAAQLKQWHLKVIEIVKRGQHRKSLDKLFQGFKPAVESCYFNWEVAYPLPGITYCSADKKSASFGWGRAAQPQRGAKAGVSGESLETGGGRGGGSESGAAEHKLRGSSHPPQQEVAVRPKETIVSKRKAMSGVNSGGMLVRLGGGMSLSIDESTKGAYKACSSSLSTSGKGKLSQSGKSSCGSSSAAGGKHPSAKRRTSSEDSSLEPDMAELSLDDGSSLALGAEASNTFDFMPPPPEMLPSPSCLLREPRKYNSSNGGGNVTKDRAFEAKRGIHAAIPLAAETQHCFPKESPMAAIAVAVEKEVDVEAELEENGGDEDPVDPDALPSISAMVTAKPSRSRREGEGSSAPGTPGPQVPEAAAAGGDPVGEDDYQAYYLSAASEEGAERGVPDSNLEEEPDIFAGIKPLEQEGRMEVSRFVRLGFFNADAFSQVMHKLWCALFKTICCV